MITDLLCILACFLFGHHPRGKLRADSFGNLEKATGCERCERFLE